MIDRHRRPAKRLLVLPSAVVLAILGMVIVTPTRTDRPPDAGLEVSEVVAPLAVDGAVCQRDGDAPDLDRDPLPAGDGRVTSEMVLACPTIFDGLVVTYVGELVGDLLPREGGAWVLVNDDEYALRLGPLPSHREHAGTNAGLSVWLPDDLLGAVTGLGRPGVRGDVVELAGHIERTDPQDGGGLTLRATALTILRPSEPVAEPLDRPQALLAVASVLAGAVAWTLRRRAARR